MKQILFCYKEDRKLRVRSTILTDVYVPVQDVISPQKTTLKVLKTDKVKISDIIIVKDNDSGIIEFIGYVDTITTKTTTEISCYPLINVFDNDYVLDQLYEETTNVDGTKTDSAVDVISWLTKQLTRAFIDTDDKYQALPLIIRNQYPYPVFYKKILDTSNLFEAYTDIFVNTGVYIEFNELHYDGYYIDGIYCDIYCNMSDKPIYLRYDNPQIQSVDIVDNTFTNYNKVIATQKQEEDDDGNLTPKNPQRYFFYLLDNNEITTNPDIDEVNEAEENEYNTKHAAEIEAGTLKKKSLGRRFKQVRCKEVSVEIDTEKTAEENAKSFILAAYNELQASEYNLAITITMFKNNKIKLHKIVEFFAENAIIYTSRVTKLEILNDKQIKVTLGALRNSLTDFKKKIEEI